MPKREAEWTRLRMEKLLGCLVVRQTSKIGESTHLSHPTTGSSLSQSVSPLSLFSKNMENENRRQRNSRFFSTTSEALTVVLSSRAKEIQNFGSIPLHRSARVGTVSWPPIASFFGLITQVWGTKIVASPIPPVAKHKFWNGCLTTALIKYTECKARLSIHSVIPYLCACLASMQ